MEIDKNMWSLIGRCNREQESPETALPRAKMHKANRNFEEAILDFEFYIKFNPDDVLPYFLLADCYYYIDDFNNAIANYEHGIAKIQGNVPDSFLNNYAGALLEIEEFEKALVVAESLIKQNKDICNGFFLKSQALLQIEKYDTAFYYISKAIEIEKNQWQLWGTRIKIDYCLGDYNRVLQGFKTALLLNPSLPGHYYTTHALALQSMGKTEEAIKEFEKAKNLGDPEAIKICKSFYK